MLVVINVMQEKAPKYLPEKLRNWDWLPLWLHSLEPYDKFLTKYILVCQCAQKLSSVQPVDNETNEPSRDSEFQMKDLEAQKGFVQF